MFIEGMVLERLISRLEGFDSQGCLHTNDSQRDGSHQDALSYAGVVRTEDSRWLIQAKVFRLNTEVTGRERFTECTAISQK